MKRHLLAILGLLLIAPGSFAIVDTNHNGLSDLWEKAQNNGELFGETFDPNADSDSDGWTNAQEAAAGTNPLHPNPPDGIISPEIVHIPAVVGEENGVPVVITPEAITVSWPTIAGKQYTLLFSPDLTEESWLLVGDPFIAYGGEATYGFEISQSDKCFWRVSVQDIDEDGDGLTDAEERQIGSSPYLADTDGDGINDSTAFASGLNPSGSGSDSDGDGIPDNELYSVVFEVQEQYRSMTFSVGYESYESSDTTHQYLTLKNTEMYSVSGSPSYTDVTDGQHVRTTTYLVNGMIPDDGQPVVSEVGTTFSEWRGSHSQTIGEDETIHRGTSTRSIAGPTITGTQFKSVTTDTTPWTITSNGAVVRSGTEIITITEQTDLSDATTYPQFWTNHVKSRPWQELQPYQCGPHDSMDYLRAVFGDAQAAEYIRNYFLDHNFSIFGTISDPGRTYADHGSDIRIKSLRWRWVRFSPQSPFGYEYIAPPASMRRSFHLLVSQSDFVTTYKWTGGPQIDETATKGIVEIDCNANEGSTGWQTVPLSKFDPYKLEDPAVLDNMDFSKVGWSGVRFGNLPAQIIPARNSLVSADDHSINLVFQMGDGWNQSQQDSTIEWQIESGSGGILSETETQIKDGLTSVNLNTSTVKDAKYVLKTRIKAIGPEGDDISGASPWIESSEIEVVAGKPHTFAFTTTKSSYHSDGTDTSQITATIKDQYGNLVEDGTPVSWSVGQCPTSPFISKDESTVDGIAKAVLRAPLIPDVQDVVCSAGDKQDNVTVAVEGVTGTISGEVSLDIGAGGQSAIIVNTDAADGTPVYWTSSNGEITSQSTVAGGVATASLSAANGRLGTVVVTASVGDHLFYTEGAFSSSSGVAIGADHPVLMAGATADGVHTPNYPHGLARSIPFWASTPVRIKGPPNSVVNLNAQASLPLASWAFNQAQQNVTPSADGLHGMTLANATIDGEIWLSGAGSLALDGSGSGSIPDSSEFHFTDQFNASIWLRPNQATAATIAAKAGSWQINQLADGRIQASVITGTDTYTVATDGPVPIDMWTRLEVDFRFDRLQIKLDGLLSAQTATSGTVSVTNNPIVVGSGFYGNLDTVSFRSEGDAASLASLAGLGADNSLQLDANGEAVVTITSTGNANGGDSIHISVSAPQSGQNPGGTAPSSPLDNPDVAEVIVDFADAVHWDACYDTVMSFIGGDPQTTQGTVSSIAGSMCVVGDVGSCAKNLWRMTAWSDTKPNYVELTLGGLGILTTLPEATGAGAVVDAGMASLKVLAQRFGNNQVAKKFLTVFIDQIKNTVVLSEKFGEAEASFLAKMVTDIPVADAFKLFLHDEALAKAAIRATEKLGDNAESFYQATRRAVAAHGEESAKKFVQAFEGLGDEAFDALKNAPASELDDALDGLAKVANKGIAPFTLKRVLDNPSLYGSAYKRTNLLKDLGELADIPNLKGLEEAIAMLKATNAQAKGFRYEIEGAAWLARNEKEVVELTKRVAVVIENGAQVVKTDIDVVIREGNNLIYYQFKRSKEALGYGENGLKATKAWVAKAMKDLELEIPDYSRIKYALPEGVTLPPQIKKWFDSLGQPSIEIVRIPHLD